MEIKNGEKCLFPDCKRSIYSRGLCRNCYLCARRLIATKQTTWEVLEKTKKVNPASRTKSGYKKDWFLRRG